ncbi:Dynein heavy chain [Glycine soja]
MQDGPSGTSTLVFRGLHVLANRGLHALTLRGLCVLTFRGLHVLTFRGLHALAIRGLRVLTFRGLHALAIRGLHVLTFRWLHALAIRGLHVLTFVGLHALTFRGLHVLANRGLHALTLRGLHVLVNVGLHALTFRGLHVLAFRGLHVLTIRGLHALTSRGLHVLALRGLHVLTIRGLHALTSRGLHVLTFRGLHALAFRGLHVLTIRGLHALTSRGLHVLALRGLHVLTIRGLHALTSRGLHVLALRGLLALALGTSYPHLERTKRPRLERTTCPHHQRAARPHLQRTTRPHLERTTCPHHQRVARPHLQRTTRPRLERATRPRLGGLHVLTFVGLHALTFRGPHVLTFRGLHALVIRGLHVLTFVGLHALTFRGLHVLANRGLHALTFRGLHVLANRGLHALNLRGLHALTFRGLYILALRGLHALTFRGLRVLIFSVLHIRTSSFLLTVPGPPPDIGGRPTVRAQPEREAITQLLCIPGQDFTRAAAKRRMTLLLSNILPNDRNANLSLQKYQLVCVVPTWVSMHMVQLISDTIYCLQGSHPQRHPVDLKKSNRALGFPALGARSPPASSCRRGIVLGSACRPQQGHQVPPTNRAFIKKFCVSRQAQGETPQQPGDGRQRAIDAPPSPLEFTSAHPQKGLSIAYTTWPTNSGENTETFSSLTSYPELRRSEFLIGGYVGAKASLLSTAPLSVTMTQELVACGDTLRLSAPRVGGQNGHLRPFRRCRHLLVETFSSLTSYPELRRSEFLIGGYVGARASLLSTAPPFVAMTQELVARGDTLRLSAPRHSVTPKTKFGHSAPLYHPEAAGPMIRGDTLRLSAPFCHPEAAGPMTSRDQIWSFCTLVSSRGGGPDDTRRYLTVIRTLLSSRGGGPDDKQRPNLAAGPMIRGDTLRLSAPFCHPEAAGPMTSRDQVWSFCTLVSSRGGGPDDTRKYPSGYPYKYSFAISEALPKRFRNVFREESRKGFNRSSTFFIRSSSFFDLQRVSTSNQAFRFILCTRSGPHCVSCIFILVLFTFYTPC